MSVYRDPRSPYYQFDFEIGGHRFFGSTKKKNRREAEAVEDDEHKKAEQEIAAAKAAKTSLALDDIAGRYWTEVGQHHAGSDNTWRDLERLIGYFGKTTLITELTDDDVARLVAWRRGHRVVRSKKKRKQKEAEAPFITNATVNRSTTEVLKKLFTRSKRAWRIQFEHEPNWKEHRLPEPKERVRELVGDEGERLEEATREDYAPFFDFARASGLRLNECLLKWHPEVDWDAGEIRKTGKAGGHITIPITSTIRAILWPLRGQHPEYVFTYVAQRTRDGRIKGQRYPLTYSGVKIQWRRLRERSGVKGFRFHDFRHDVATKLLRETGNLKLVQQALNHANIKTTTKYAHVLQDEVAAAMETIQARRRIPDADSRIRSRTGRAKAS
jgi:integrase